ncbi:MAG: hypothetical protein M1814_000071 [Vezdaea aestivalis]|nr:MAG: hypothetical protein M1814_000071 [Vezdaea aestivalis]
MAAQQQHRCQLQDDPASTTLCWHDHCAMAAATSGLRPNALSSRESSSNTVLSPVSPARSGSQRWSSNSRTSDAAAQAEEIGIESAGTQNQLNENTGRVPNSFGAVADPDPDPRKSIPSTPDVSTRASYQSTAAGTVSPTTSASISYGGDASSFQNVSMERDLSLQPPIPELADQTAEIEAYSWSEFSPPQELHAVEDDLAPELTSLVKESMAKQWQIIKAEEERRRNPPLSITHGLKRTESISTKSIMSPMLANEAVLEEEQPGLQVVEMPRFLNSKEASRLVTNHLTAPESSSAPSHRLSLGALSSRSSSTGGDKPGRPGSISSSVASHKKATSKTLVAVGPMGFMEYNRSSSTQERYVAPKPVSPWAEKLKKRKEKNKPAECIVCVQDLKNKDLIELGCKHKYCKTCFATFVIGSMNDEQKFPPKCCQQQVPPKLVHSSLSSDQSKLYKQREKEFSIPSNARFYCPSEKCTKWIDTIKYPIAKDKKNLKCPSCKTKVCTICRGFGHDEWQACPQDFALEATLEESSRNGWQRCPSCRTMIELSVGCRHMTCKCKAEFCYVCGAPWMTCACTEEDQYRRQQEILDRHVLDNEKNAEAEAAIRADQVLEEEEAARAVQEAEDRRLETERRLEQTRTELNAHYDHLIKALSALHTYQRVLMLSRHEAESQSLAQEHMEANHPSDPSAGTPPHLITLQASHQSRAAAIGVAHKKAIEDLEASHQEQEDDTFVRITMQVRGKPNAEVRAKKMTDQVLRMQVEKRAELLKAQEAEFTALLRREKQEVLEAEMKAERDEKSKVIKQRNSGALQKKRLWAQVEWFNAVEKKRGEMLAEERVNKVDAVGKEENESMVSAKENEANLRPMHPLEEKSRKIHSEYGITY